MLSNSAAAPVERVHPLIALDIPRESDVVHNQRIESRKTAIIRKAMERRLDLWRNNDFNVFDEARCLQARADLNKYDAKKCRNQSSINQPTSPNSIAQMLSNSAAAPVERVHPLIALDIPRESDVVHNQRIESRKTAIIRKAMERRLDLWRNNDFNVFDEARCLQARADLNKYDAKKCRNQSSINQPTSPNSIAQMLSNSAAAPVERVHPLIALDIPRESDVVHNQSLQWKWTHFLRTTSCSDDDLAPLRDAITGRFLKEMTKQVLSEDWVKVLTSPIREGGLGIISPLFVKDLEFSSSERMCSSFTSDCQGVVFRTEQQRIGERITAERKTAAIGRFNYAKSNLNEISQEALAYASVYGASSWLSIVPPVRENFHILPREFRDSMAMRYA
ncbi:hypothetical protein GJ496_009589 [Pomphorhynchus laevis]|nr:hypothetical protein GJ496_009589 [Pomphorhynchus laevis]